MNNPLFQALGGTSQGNSTLTIIQQFKRFISEMKGKDPNDEINKLLQSGELSQQQLNQVQQMAQQMQGIFNQTK